MAALNLLDLISFLRRYGVRIAAWSLGFAIAGALLSYVVPPTYESTAVILPPEEDQLSAALSLSRRGSGGLGALTRLGGSYFTQADVALATLRSQTVHLRVVRDLDLQAVYKTKSPDDAAMRLRDQVTVRISTDGTIAVIARDRTPDRAAKIANSFLEHLDSMTREFRTSEARRTREFLARRVAETDSLLHTYEQRLVAYQARRGAVVMSPEMRGGSDAAAALVAQKVGAEVELQMARRYSSPNSEEIQRLQARVNELGRQIGSLPATQAGGSDLIRQAAIQQQVLGILTGQLEEARIREVMDTPTIQVLDPARPPERKKWPRRSWLAGFGAIAGALAAGIPLLLNRPLQPRV